MIVFDLDDTLHLRSEPFSRAAEEICGIPRISADMPSIFEDFRRIGMEYFRRWDQGEITEQEMYIRRAMDAFSLHGISFARKEAWEFQETYERHLKTIRLAEGIEDVLRLASEKGIGLGILTNGSSKRQRDKIAALGLTRWISETAIAVSSELGIHKPDMRIFVAYREKLKKNGIDADSSGSWWYVGDSYENDIEPASKAGWNTIWMNRYDTDGGRKMQVQPDHRVRSAEELSEIILKM